MAAKYRSTIESCNEHVGIRVRKPDFLQLYRDRKRGGLEQHSSSLRVKDGEKETGDELEAGVVKEDIRLLDLGQKHSPIGVRERGRERSGGNFKEGDNEVMEPMLRYLFSSSGFSAPHEISYFDCGFFEEDLYRL